MEHDVDVRIEASCLLYLGYNLSTVNTVLICCKHGRGSLSSENVRVILCRFNAEEDENLRNAIQHHSAGLVNAQCYKCQSANVGRFKCDAFILLPCSSRYRPALDNLPSLYEIKTHDER